MKMKLNKQLLGVLLVVLLGSCASVSYTHLDVYKRQYLYSILKEEFQDIPGRLEKSLINRLIIREV